MSSIGSILTNTATDFNKAVAAQEGSDLDKESFMLLLVTQFQYQDPLDPLEDTEFIAQLAQFSSLEQLMTLNESMAGVTDVIQDQELINATSYIGKTVDATGNSVSKKTDATTGDVSIGTVLYAIGETSVQGTMNIFDANNNLVNSMSLPTQAAGTHKFNWDGTYTDGSLAPDGVYYLVPVFYNAEGATITNYDMVVDGRVSGVTTDSGVTYLTLDDGRMVDLADVRRVSEATVVSSGTTGDTETDEDGDADVDGESTTEPDANGDTSTDTESSTDDSANTGDTPETTLT